MNETTRPPRENESGPGGFGHLFDDPDNSALVTVSSGPYVELLPLADTPVGEIRRRFQDRFDIDPESQAVLDGHDVDDETRVRPGQALMFTRRAGEKGGV